MLLIEIGSSFFCFVFDTDENVGSPLDWTYQTYFCVIVDLRGSVCSHMIYISFLMEVYVIRIRRWFVVKSYERVDTFELIRALYGKRLLHFCKSSAAQWNVRFYDKQWFPCRRLILLEWPPLTFQRYQYIRKCRDRQRNFYYVSFLWFTKSYFNPAVFFPVFFFSQPVQLNLKTLFQLWLHNWTCIYQNVSIHFRFITGTISFHWKKKTFKCNASE